MSFTRTTWNEPIQIIKNRPISGALIAIIIKSLFDSGWRSCLFVSLDSTHYVTSIITSTTLKFNSTMIYNWWWLKTIPAFKSFVSQLRDLMQGVVKRIWFFSFCSSSQFRFSEVMNVSEPCALVILESDERESRSRLKKCQIFIKFFSWMLLHNIFVCI